jgi:molybdate transport system substrate-binding protein
MTPTVVGCVCAPDRALRPAGLLAALLAAAALPAWAADRTTLNVLVASNMKPAFVEIAAAYEKAHPDVAVEGTFTSSTVIETEVEQGAAVDAIVISRLVVEPKITAAVDAFLPVYKTHTVIAVAKAAAGKITSAKDLAKPGVRLGMGTAGSAVSVWQDEETQKLGAAYGKDFAAHYAANIQIKKTDILHLLAALDDGSVDAVFVFSSDIDPAKMVKVDFPPDLRITVPFVAASVKASAHGGAARDFAAYLASAPAKAILADHGFDVR